MAIYDFWLSRNNGPTLQNYVGHAGRLFYDSDEKVLRVSDGVTPGGSQIFPIATVISATEPTVVPEGQLWLNPTTFELWAYHDGAFIPTIDLATDTKIGGVKLGPGVITNAEGQITIDSTGLDFSFGDFAAITGTYPVGHPKAGENYAIVQTINSNEDAVLASNGSGSIKVVGNFQIYAPDGDVNGTLMIPPIFTVGNDGQVKIYVPDTDTNEGAVEIVGSTSGESVAPGQPGTMLHLTGQVNEQCRFYIDGNGNYASIVGRRWNGTIAGGRTQVLAGEDILRINATAQTDTQMPGVAAAQIRFRASEDHTDTAQGSTIEFLVTRNGTTAALRETGLIVDNTGIAIPGPDSGVIFYGDTSGTIALRPTAVAGTNTITLPAATGTAVVSAAGANTVTGVLAGTLNIDPAAIGKNTSSTQTFTLTGLTTNHKVIVMPQAALPYQLVISAAWASAANTLSIQFQEFGGGVDAAAFNLTYFAWV